VHFGNAWRPGFDPRDRHLHGDGRSGWKSRGAFRSIPPVVNIAEDIFQKADPSAAAVLHGGVTTTYGDLEKKSARLAARLQSGTRVGLSCPDSADYIAAALGILRAGGCFVPLAPELSPRECGQLVGEVALDAILRGSKDGEFEVEEVPPPQIPPPWLADLREVSPAFIRFTSGTTGDSKGIVISHSTLLERILAANAGLHISAEDRVLWVLPMSHHFAVSIMLYLWHGATIVLPESHLAEDVLIAAQRQRATVFYGAPFHFESLSGRAGGSWPALRLAVSTTAALSMETAGRFAEAFGIFPAQALGIIECGLPCLNVPSPQTNPTSVGRPQPAFEARLDADSKLHLRGPGFLDAYLSPWQPRREILDAEGWFATGDIAKFADDGRVVLLGRSHAVIGVGGMKFFPEEVEAVLCNHASIDRARVSGRPHPDFGMVPVAEVVLKHGSPAPKPIELLSHCRSQLSRHKIPAEIRFVDSIPLTASGKIKRA
jgi:long-chain acyl-CoA synthetase